MHLLRDNFPIKGNISLQIINKINKLIRVVDNCSLKQSFY